MDGNDGLCPGGNLFLDLIRVDAAGSVVDVGNTGVAPVWMMVLAVEANVIGVVMTSSPGPIPFASNAM